MRVAFVVRALGLGGAERQLVSLAVELRRKGHDVLVVTLYPNIDRFDRALAEGGVSLHCVEKRGRWDVVGSLLRLRALLLSWQSDVIYSFLPTSNVLCSLLLIGRGQSALVWGIRATVILSPGHDWLGRLMVRLEQALRSMPDLVIVNSQSGIEACIRRGYRPERLRFVRNQLDQNTFRFDEAERIAQRAAWNRSSGDVLVGIAGRIEPLKGLEYILPAMALLRERGIPARLVVAGDGDKAYVSGLKRIASDLKVDSHVDWLGIVPNMKGFYCGIDMLCSASIAEGMSNVIAEALGCGVRCVVTDVGDSGAIISADCVLVAPKNVSALAEGLSAAVAGREYGREARRAHVIELLGSERCVDDTVRAFAEAIGFARSRVLGAGSR